MSAGHTVAFDLQAVQSVAHGERGIARFVFDLAASVAAEHPDLVDLFLWNDTLPRSERLDALDLGGRLRSFSEVRGTDVDVLHLNSPFEGLRIGDFMPPVRAKRLVATCYDLIPYRFPRQYLSDSLARARYRNRLALLTVADALVTDSLSAAHDATELLGIDPRRLTVIGAGVGPQFRPAETPLDDRMASLRSQVPGLLPRFVLVPTGVDWRKNTANAISAYARLPRDVRDRHQLVLSCRLDDHHRRLIDDQCDRLGVAGHVLVTGFVPDETLVSLYQTAELVFFPSVYEGFGLPVLEARRCGTPVVCSDRSSLQEVLPDPSAWFNPYDVADMAKILERALCDAEFTARLRAVPDAGFTWSNAARRLAGVYREQLAALRQAPAPAGVRRLAVVSPLPPDRNGVAFHSARLLAAIDDHIDDVEVTAYIPWGAPAIARQVGYRVRNLGRLLSDWTAGEFDAVLYCVGNHEIHRSALPMLELVPGHVLVHDARLRGALADLDWHRLRGAGIVDDDSRAAAPFVDRAISTLVQSAYAADLVEAETGVRPRDVGPIHVPEAADPAELDGADGLDDGRPWVITAGIADETKRTDVFVAAADRLIAAGVARCAVVGPLGERFVKGTEVATTGWVDDDALVGWLRRATLVVALRDETNGESSGIVADAIAHGCVVVVSDVGAMSELPDGVVSKVPGDISAADLSTHLIGLLDHPDRRAVLSAAALAFAATQTPLDQARRIVDAVFS